MQEIEAHLPEVTPGSVKLRPTSAGEETNSVAFTAATRSGGTLEGTVTINAVVDDSVVKAYAVVTPTIVEQPHTKTATRPAEVLLADGGVITSLDVVRLLEPRIGTLQKVRFRPSVSPNAVTWEGLDRDGRVTSGRLTMNIAISPGFLAVWADVSVGGDDENIKFSSRADEYLGVLEDVRRIGNRGRELIDCLRRDPSAPRHEIVAKIVQLVELVDNAERRMVEAAGLGDFG
jgi:hypothetical protein